MTARILPPEIPQDHPSDSRHARQAYGVTILKNGHRDIRRLRRQYPYPSIHGNKVWNSAYLIMDYLKEEPLAEGLRVLEIGCGWGITGIYCAKQFNTQVTALDADETVFPYLQHHAAINGVTVTSLHAKYEAMRSVDLAEFDVIVGSDICFWDEMTKPLFNLIKRAKNAGVERVILADPGRPPFEAVADQCCDKLDAELIDWMAPHPYNATGWLLLV